MALISPGLNNPPAAASNNQIESRSRVCREFTALVMILYHSTTLTPKYQAMLHCGTIRQTVQIVSMTLDSSDDSSGSASHSTQIGRTGDRAKIRFRFLKEPEMLKMGIKIVFREGRTRGIGKIIELHE